MKPGKAALRLAAVAKYSAAIGLWVSKKGPQLCVPSVCIWCGQAALVFTHVVESNDLKFTDDEQSMALRVYAIAVYEHVGTLPDDKLSDMAYSAIRTTFDHFGRPREDFPYEYEKK